MELAHMRKGGRDIRVLKFIDDEHGDGVKLDSVPVSGANVLASLPQKGVLTEVAFRRFCPDTLLPTPIHVIARHQDTPSFGCVEGAERPVQLSGFRQIVTTYSE